MRKEQVLGRRRFLVILGTTALGAAATACGPERNTQAGAQPPMVMATGEPSPPTPNSRPETQPKLFTERETALKMSAEQRTINNKALSEWRQSLPDSVRVTVTTYGKRQKNTVNAPPTAEDTIGGLLTRGVPDLEKGVVTYPTYLHNQIIETEFTITLSYPDGSRSQWDMVNEHPVKSETSEDPAYFEGHFARASHTTSAEMGAKTERTIKRALYSGDALSLNWDKNTNTLQHTAEEPDAIIILYDRQPTLPPKPEKNSRVTIQFTLDESSQLKR